MQKRQYIWIWTILALTLCLHYYLQSKADLKSINEDPTSQILQYIDKQHEYLEDELVPFALVNENEGTKIGLQIDNLLSSQGLSLQIEIKDSIHYRSNSIDGKKICNVLILEGPVKVTRCVGVFDKEGNLNPKIEENYQLSNSYKIVSDDNSGIPIYLNNEQFVIQGTKKQINSNTNWLLFPLFSSLILLLIWPFKFKLKKSPFLWFGGIALLLIAYYLLDVQVKFDWKLPCSFFVLFSSLYFWRKEYNFNIKLESQRVILQWLIILIPFIVANFCIWDGDKPIDIINPFKTLSKITTGDVRIIISLVILMLSHLIGLHQHWLFVKRNFKKGNKYLIIVGLLGCIHFFSFYFIQLTFPIIPAILSIIIYFLLVDLFTEGKQNPVIWAILWNVFLSIIIAGAIYYGEFSKTVRNIEDNVSSGFYQHHKGSLNVYNINNLPEYYKAEVNNFEDIGIQSFYKDAQIHFIDHKSNGDLHIVKFDIPGFIKAITLFSFVFIIGISGYFLLTLLHKRINFLPRLFYPGEIYLSSFSRRIQISYLILTVISFIGIAAITIILLNNYFKDSEREALKNNLNLIGSQVDYLVHQKDYDESKIKESIKEYAIQAPFELEVFNNQGLNIRNPEQFISTAVMEYLDTNKSGSLSEHVTENRFNSYINVKHNEYKYAHITGINKQGKSSLSIYDFVAGILNVYVFLFIIAITFGLFVSKSIVDPLARLSNQMKKLRLGKENEEIVWTGDGEVAELIENYNAMVRKLEDSANLIAHTERDMAWREMARQVAHEIKNPLTPMKLTLQYLQKQVDRGQIPDKENLDRIALTLLEQIENLSNISGAFSNVAKLPKASNEKVVLNEVVESVHDLFRKREDMNIRLSEPINDLIVFADKNHLVRILNNIVKNAIESIPENRLGEIEISLFKEHGDAIIKVSDNGNGIPKSMQNKIFTPKFTTKNSGSGLGLAIAANMAESFNGRIYFETKEDEGTDFFIQIPLMRLSENKDGNRVILD